MVSLFRIRRVGKVEQQDKMLRVGSRPPIRPRQGHPRKYPRAEGAPHLLDIIDM
jgi:hypothetical protein